MFPGRSANDIVKAVPSMFPFASKRLKSADYQSFPDPSDTVSSSISAKKPNTDKETTLEDHFDYDFSHQRVRCLPLHVMTDLILEYIRWPFRPSTPTQINRTLGGSMTTYNLASRAFEFDAGKAGGKVNKL